MSDKRTARELLADAGIDRDTIKREPDRISGLIPPFADDDRTCPEVHHERHFWSAWYIEGKKASRRCQYCNRVEHAG